MGLLLFQELFEQFEAVEINYVNGSSVIQCQNGDMAMVGNGRYHGMSLRQKISRRCRQKEEPFCTDHSDVTVRTCAWACLHFNAVIENTASMAWPCPGEAKCIGRNQICDGVSDCSNGQDEDKNLCTEDFCKNGFVSYDSNHINYTSSDDDIGTYRYYTDLAEMTYDYIFLDYRYPNYPPNQMDYYRSYFAEGGSGKVIIPNLQNIEMPKCKNSTKCLRRSVVDDDSDKWIEC